MPLMPFGSPPPPKKATGAEINTGTDNTKYVTPKAIADSYISALPTATSTTTFTNKTLTSPKINEDVALTATATQLNALVGAGGSDGWISANETWTYASASTINVPSGAASKYAVGDRIKFTQTTVKYGVIVTVADTLLTIAVNTDYVVANAAITSNYYSHQVNPVGYPSWFSFSPAYVGFSTNPSLSPLFAIVGKLVTISLVELGAGTSNATNFTMGIIGIASYYSQGIIRVCNNGTYAAGYYQTNPGGVIVTFNATLAAGAAFTNSGAKSATGYIQYLL